MSNSNNSKGSSGSKKRGKKHRGSRKSNGQAPKSSEDEFTGLCAGMKGNLFDVGPGQATQFIKTKEVLILYAWGEYSPEVSKALDKMACMKDLIEEPKDPKPAGKDGKLSMTQQEMVKYQARRYLAKQEKYDNDLRAAYGLIIGQCTEALKQQLQADKDFSVASFTSDSMLLLKIVQRICYNYRSEMYPPASSLRALKSLLSTRQGENTTNAEWMTQFTSLVRSVDACGAIIGLPGINDYMMSTEKYKDKKLSGMSDVERALFDKDVREVTLATLYMEKATASAHRSVLEQSY